MTQAVKNPPANVRNTGRRLRLDPWVGKIPWGRKWQPTPVCLPGNSLDRESWWATVHSVAKSQTQLKWLSKRYQADIKKEKKKRKEWEVPSIDTSLKTGMRVRSLIYPMAASQFCACSGSLLIFGGLKYLFFISYLLCPLSFLLGDFSLGMELK